MADGIATKVGVKLPPGKYLAVFFDLDGTLADSLNQLRQVFSRFMADYGMEASEREFASLNGPPLSEIITRLQRDKFIEGDRAQMLARYLSYVDDAYQDVRPVDGAAALLDTLRGSGRTVGLVTSNGRNRTQQWLRAQSLDHYFSFLVCSEDVDRGKPDPEPYRCALEKSGFSARQAIAVEDSRQGVMAVQAAGIQAVYVGESWSGDSRQARPIVVSDLAEAVQVILREV